MIPKLSAIPILMLVVSLSTMSLVNAESSDSTGTTAGTTLHVDFGNGHFFDIPYSISGATVIGAKADTSIPKLTVSITPTQDGQITLQVPGGKDGTQQNLTVLVDGQSSQYTQSFDNGHRMVTISFHATSSTIELVGQHNAAQNIQYNQTSSSCSQDDITAAKQGLAEIQKKMTDTKTQYYNDWQTAHNSGQYNGTFEQYSHEKISSSDISQIKSDYQKYSSVLRSCGVAGHMMRPMVSPSTTCSQDDVSHARQELATSEKQGMDLRNKIYQQFQTDQTSGQFNGTWAQYAKENFYNLPEIVQIKSTHDKFSSFLKSCFGNKVPYFAPQNQGENYTNNILPTPQSLPPISSPTDALGTISSHSIPGWVRGIAGWWAQGKISDDEFVSAIKFLVHQGIIKI